MSRTRAEAGSASVELVLLTPLLVLLLLFVVALGRLAATRLAVGDAAHQAARAASLARDPRTAVAQARDAARAALAGRAASCPNPDISLATGELRPGGAVTVRVACAVTLGDLGPLMSGRRVVAAAFTAPVDAYRGVRP